MLINGIPFSLRYYVIAQYVFQHYKPSSQTRYLEPAEDGWPGLNALNSDFNFQLDLGRLPLTWGMYRRPHMLSSVRDKKELNIRRYPSSENYNDQELSSALSEYFETRTTINSRHYNYLLIRLAGKKPREVPEKTTTTITLEFAPPNGEFDTAGQITFDVLADGLVRPYLVPIGCSPGWSWRPRIERVRLYSASLQQLSIPMIECWQFDDVAAADP